MLYDALCRCMSSSDFTIIHSLCGSTACIAKPSNFSAAASLAVSLGKLRQAISRLDLGDSKAEETSNLFDKIPFLRLLESGMRWQERTKADY